METSIKKRIDIVKATSDYETLKTHLCSFFEKGDCPDCVGCRKAESDIDDCRSYYLERIAIHPMDIWREEFDTIKVLSRDKVAVEDIVGIGVSCDRCYMYDKCPLYKKGYVCAIDWGSSRPTNPKAFYDFLVDLQYERVQRAAIFEKVDGGVADGNLSNEIDRLTDLIESQANLNRERLNINIEASGSATAPATGGGLLSRIFGSGSSTPAVEEKKTIEIPATPSSREDIAEVAEIIEEPEKVKVPRKRKSV